MWTAVALTTVMTLAPAQGIELKNVRSTYGIMGETRKDDKLLPGDIFVVHFDIEGLKVKDNGTVLYSMGMELTKKGKAKPEFKRDPQDLEAELSLGGLNFGLNRGQLFQRALHLESDIHKPLRIDVEIGRELIETPPRLLRGFDDPQCRQQPIPGCRKLAKDDVAALLASEWKIAAQHLFKHVLVADARPHKQNSIAFESAL